MLASARVVAAPPRRRGRRPGARGAPPRWRARDPCISSGRVPRFCPRSGGLTLEELGARLENTFAEELPGDPSASPEPRQVRWALHSPCAPTPTGAAPALAMFSDEMALFLGLAPDELADNPLAAEYLSGNAPLPGSGRPYAQNYGGHQFGEWAGQLGDGRAVTLGEVPPPEDRPEYPRVDLQLKGAGPTPYARDGDGRAVLRSSLREFIASEAMGALGVPTTRCLSLALTGGGVLRDGRFEAGAVVARVAPSFVRFGTFQLPPSRGDAEARALCEPLVAHVLRRHMPAAAAAAELDAGTPPALAMLRETVAATAATVAAWQALGFAHGVLNTDNMSVLGLTLDYGPFAFVERFDPNFTPNLSDRDGRYAFIRQPEVAGWNLRRFGDALTRAGLVSARQAKEAVDEYDGHLRAAYYARLGAKFGVRCEDDDAGHFLRGFLRLLASSRGDFTLAHRALGRVGSVAAASGPAASDDALLAPLEAFPGAFPDGPPEDPTLRRSWGEWLRAYGATLRAEGREDDERRASQDAANPLYVPRNHLLQRAIEAAERRDDWSVAASLMEALRQPYVERPGLETWTEPAPISLADAPGVAALS